MRKFFYFLAIAVILFTSCSKEYSTTTNPLPLDSTASNLLIKRVDIERQVDSLVTTYSYDVNKRLILQQFAGYSNSGGTPLVRNEARLFYRDALGRITKIAWKFNGVADTLYTNIIYENNTGSKILYKLGISTQSGKTRYDSTLYYYNTAGKIIKMEYYNSGNWPVEAAKNNTYENWDFDANSNLVRLQQYNYSAAKAMFELVISYDFLYDDKANPLLNSDDARLFDWFYVSNNNVTTQKVNILPTGEKYDNTVSYQYDAMGRPVSAILTRGYANGGTVNSFFYYNK